MNIKILLLAGAMLGALTGCCTTAKKTSCPSDGKTATTATCSAKKSGCGQSCCGRPGCPSGS